jgi:lipopolysaccharide export system protein LptA
LQLTIERIRTLVLLAGALLLVALGVFLVSAKWKNLLIRHDIPHRLAKDIQQEANGFTFVHAFGAHSQYKIHASKEVQLKDNRILLHEVRIELYGEDGKRVDQIDGDAFEYDQKSGLAMAEGPVEMVLTQPGAAQKSNAAARQIHVKTSGVTFDRDTGLVTTAQRVDFSMMQGSGSAIGAIYDSQNGYLTLDKSVELTTLRSGDAVVVHAQHAEFSRGAETCWMRTATAESRGSQAQAAQVKILFREDGSASRLEATDGFTLATATGGHLASPTGSMDFNEHNQPSHGHMQGGVTMDSVRNGRTVHGTSPMVELEMTGKGQLRHAHLERGVTFTSDEASQGSNGKGADLDLKRTWRSPVADIDFRDAGKGQVEPEHLAGSGGVVITSESRHGNGPAVPSKMTADQVTGEFGPDSSLESITGVGHAGIEQTTATGTRQTANGDRLQARFAPPAATTNRDQATPAGKSPAGGPAGNKGTRGQEAAQAQSSELDGHVVLFEQPAVKPGAQAQPAMHATAGKAVYEGVGEWLHLTESPRVEDGGLEMTADKVDFSQQSGDAFAHGNVKASWTGTGTGPGTGSGAPGKQSAAASNNASQGGTTLGGGLGGTLGGNGPAHVIANEAQVSESTESTGEATFRGHARLWQQANSVSGPVIVLNQHLQTLEARTGDAADPVRAVLLNAGEQSGTAGAGKDSSGRPAAPSVIRVRGGELSYSDAEHRALMHSGVLGAVVAETGTATSSSDTVELRLMPAGSHEANRGAQAQVDRMTATGHVVLTSQGRRGTGEQLVYSGASGQYVLTGTRSAPPRMSDPERGSVTGETLIFDSRDDSVSIEGGGHETRTETTAPDAHGK